MPITAWMIPVAQSDAPPSSADAKQRLECAGLDHQQPQHLPSPKPRRDYRALSTLLQP